ncbi:hypothetical protein Tco_0417787 [Tanacetum coccineum]
MPDSTTCVSGLAPLTNEGIKFLDSPEEKEEEGEEEEEKNRETMSVAIWPYGLHSLAASSPPETQTYALNRINERLGHYGCIYHQQNTAEILNVVSGLTSSCNRRRRETSVVGTISEMVEDVCQGILFAKILSPEGIQVGKATSAA